MLIKKLLKGAHNRYNRYKLYQKNKTVLSLNKDLKNLKAGKRCFILGNGPSIKKQYILKLKNEETFVVNNFWNHENYKKFHPKHYVFIDTNAFTDSDNFWKDGFVANASLLSSVPTHFFFHIDSKKMIEEKNLFPSSAINYLAFNGFFKENLNFNTDISKIVPKPKNVIVASIMVAAYMGFEEIYLLGCEHSFLANYDKHDVADHFYDPEYKIKNPEEARYYEPDPTVSYETLVADTKLLFQNYRLLKTKLSTERPKLKIYNATPCSFLDVFPYIKFEDIKL